jgi:hypothetical protein
MQKHTGSKASFVTKLQNVRGNEHFGQERLQGHVLLIVFHFRQGSHKLRIILEMLRQQSRHYAADVVRFAKPPRSPRIIRSRLAVWFVAIMGAEHLSRERLAAQPHDEFSAC